MKLFLILAWTLLVVIGVTSSYAAESQPTPVAKVVWIKGDSLKAIMPNKEERLLKKQSVINLNDLLITDNNTTAEIVFTDNTLMTFKPNTQFSIDEYKYPVKSKNSIGKSVMRLIEGGFRTITGLIAKSNSSDYKIQTPVATIGVRGTDYAIYLENGQLFAAYYAGTPCVTANNNSSTVCLSPNALYAKVTSANLAPTILTQQPEGFRTKLDITNAKIGLFTTPGSSSKNQGKPDGTISSFCIQ